LTISPAGSPLGAAMTHAQLGVDVRQLRLDRRLSRNNDCQSDDLDSPRATSSSTSSARRELGHLPGRPPPAARRRTAR
jgi:hypothetical protein